jgi:predicted DNA-binding protein YlxM (UPF0122 family)
MVARNNLDVVKIIQKYTDGVPVQKIAKQHRISSGLIYSVLYANEVPLRGRVNSERIDRVWDRVFEVIDDYQSDMTVKEVAAKYNVYPTIIYSILRAYKVPLRGYAGLMSPEGRDDEICELYRSGYTMQEIGDRYNISRQRIQQILAKFNMTYEDGGNHVKSVARQEQLKQEMDERSFNNYGYTREQFHMLRGTHEDYNKSALGKWYQFKKNCEIHGFELQLTPLEWWDIWQKSGKFHLLERAGDGYCLGRIDQKGPFSKENCVVRKFSENCRYTREQNKAEV